MSLLKEMYAKNETLPEGDGWMTHAEVQEFLGCGVNKTYAVIARGKETGDVEEFIGRKYSERFKRSVNERWYRFIK